MRPPQISNLLVQNPPGSNTPSGNRIARKHFEESSQRDFGDETDYRKFDSEKQSAESRWQDDGGESGEAAA